MVPLWWELIAVKFCYFTPLRENPAQIRGAEVSPSPVCMWKADAKGEPRNHFIFCRNPLAGCFQLGTGHFWSLWKAPLCRSKAMLTRRWACCQRGILLEYYIPKIFPASCASPMQRGWGTPRRSLCSPCIAQGFGALQPAVLVPNCTHQGTSCNAQMLPTLRGFPFRAKITTVLPAKQLYRASVFVFYI